MRAVTSGVSAAGTWAVLQQLLEPRLPILPPLDPGWCEPLSFEWKAFSCGLVVGAFLVVLIQWLATLRWLLIQLVQQHLDQRRERAPGGGHPKLYRFLDEPCR